MNPIEAPMTAALRDADLPGVVCAAAGPSELLDTTSLGTVAFGSAEPMALDTTFWIASITKLVTAVAVLQLVEQGSLGLNDDVARHLPWFENLQVLTEAGLTPAPRPVTVRQLLTHTAGFGYETWSRPLADHVSRQGLPAARTGLRCSLERPLLFPPGAKWNYGIGMDWAGLLVERVTGRSLFDHLRCHVFDPLGMASTSFTPRQGAARAVVHSRQADGSALRTPIDPNPDREFDSGGAGLYSTTRDVLRLLQSILRASRGSQNEILQPKTVGKARRNQIGLLEVRDLLSNAPDRSRDLAPFSGRRRKWSFLGMLHVDAEPGRRAAGSVSWAGVANTFFWIDFKAEVAAVVFTQSLPFLDPRVVAMVERYEDLLYARIAA